MALETGVAYIEDLVSTNPVGATDNVDEGDDHIRNIKTAVQGSFPSLGSVAVTLTASEINDLPTKTGIETLTNKTLTSPTINTPTFSAGAVDTADIATDAVTANEIVAGAVGASELASTEEMTTTNVANSTAGLNIDVVGSYVFAKNASGGTINPGGTIAGSNLSYAGVQTLLNTTGSMSGTWRCMGYAPNQFATLWLRIS